MKMQRNTMKMQRNTTYRNVYFTGGAYMATYQLGAVLCFLHNNIRFEHAFSVSAGILSSLCVLYEDAAMVDDMFVGMLQWRFSQCYFFGMRHMTEVMCRLLSVLFEKYKDISRVMSRMSVCAFNVWRMASEQLTPDSIAEFYHVCACTIRLVPFVSLTPYRYKGEHYIDNIFVRCLPVETPIDVCVATTWQPMPEARTCIQNGLHVPHTMLFASKSEMIDGFVRGYRDTQAKIADARAFDVVQYAQRAHDIFTSGKHMYAEAAPVAITQLHAPEYAYHTCARIVALAKRVIRTIHRTIRDFLFTTI